MYIETQEHNAIVTKEMQQQVFDRCQNIRQTFARIDTASYAFNFD